MSVLEYSRWSAPIAAAVFAAVALVLLARGRGRLPQDYPTERSLHARPVSRVGGIAIWAGFLPVALLSSPPVGSVPAWLAAWAAVTIVSFVDDWRGVPPPVRLAVHAFAALAVVATLPWQGDAAGSPVPHLFAVAAAVIAIVWSANLFNFMDGSDGLAALMAICGFGAYGVAATRAGASADVLFALAAAALVFFAVNRPPARTFMGDCGSVGLGFLAAAFGYSGFRAEIWPGWFPLLVFLPFGADATVTVLRRLARGDHLFEAHRTHYYQRLHQMGSGHGGTLLFYAVLIVGTTASALATQATAPGAGWWVLSAWIAAIGALFAGIDYQWRKRRSE